MLSFKMLTMRSVLLICLLAMFARVDVYACIEKTDYPYQNPRLSVEERVADLLSRMTLEEKVYQMSALRLGEGDEIFQTSGAFTIEKIRQSLSKHGIGYLSCPTTDMEVTLAARTANMIQKVAVEETRLGIPVLIDAEALHGLRAKGATSYPQSIALSCAWNPDLMYEIGNAIGKETKSRGINQVLSPTLDLARDPRHGRMEECYGEDPYLASRLGIQFIKGIQQHGISCSPKHFLANFVGEGGRDSGNSGLSERELREIHMVPFEAAVKEAKTHSMMAAYNSIDGIPCSANHWLLTDVLRKEWGFDGFVVSDWSSVSHAYGHLHIAPSLNEAAALCAKAGLDVELPRLKSYVNLPLMVEQGKIAEESINENVKHILRVKFQLGLFEHPYVDESQAALICNADTFRTLARKAARQSMVLLKNDKKILPLAKVNKLAVIGPNAGELVLGGYSAEGVQGVSPLEGLKQSVGKEVEILYAKGCDLTSDDKSGFDEAVEIARSSDVCVLVMGGRTYYTGGETHDRNTLDLMGVQEELIAAIADTGKPIVVILVDGRPVTMEHWMDKADGIVMMFYAGEEGGHALAEILTGKTNPSGKLSMTYPRTIGDLPMCLLHRPYGREGSIVEYGTDRLPADRYCPLFPFGYGLSYSTYMYDHLILANHVIKKGGNVQFTVDVTNTGQRDGDEIIQVYLTDLYCRITQPEKILKSFQRVHLKAGETKSVSFELPYESLSFLNESLQPEVEPGEFELHVGSNCVDGLKVRFTAR